MIIYEGFIIGVKIAVAIMTCTAILVLFFGLCAAIASAGKRGDRDE